ncbi:DUF4388 domain-containing protein [Cronbergia sp. UHCC 0137]|uniref:DUF4388 domain-containing protein n=1 Tax=Cronbergia sp. UHCC 0137 TaxID=3110239 RepID=UPI002B2107BF|nr:DUF4388 domain-containing protein [Cronbergia sp. UHCC 0137]MEA5618809.1 DUF4388 domain-containing protein [Cronbergia sp. UHCC 0137]
MTITGNFEDFSLPELLQFLDQGKKTGRLCIELGNELEKNSTKKTSYIWVHQGRIMTVTNRLDEQGLTLMIAQRGWASERVISRVMQTSSCFISEPMGLCLKSQGLLQPEQLKLLFHTQVLQPICSLFPVREAFFRFEPTRTFPLGEMTGLSMTSTEVILIGLRSLRNWSSLEEKLPDPSSGLSSLMVKQPNIPLNNQEWQVWEFLDGRVSLKDIASQLRIPLVTVQQIAFRLIVVGLAEEEFMTASTSTSVLENTISEEALVETVPHSAQKSGVNQSIQKSGVSQSIQKSGVSESFLKNLVGFLRSK